MPRVASGVVVVAAVLFSTLVSAGRATAEATDVENTRQLAEQGDVHAQYNLGLKYDLGEGVPEDDAAAVGWFQKAADQGLSAAQLNLAIMYADGTGVPANYIQAYKWANLARAAGEARAGEFLAILVSRMTTEQVAEAQRLSSEWHAAHHPTSR